MREALLSPYGQLGVSLAQAGLERALPTLIEAAVFLTPAGPTAMFAEGLLGYNLAGDKLQGWERVLMMAPLAGQIAEEAYIARSMQEVTFGVGDAALLSEGSEAGTAVREVSSQAVSAESSAFRREALGDSFACASSFSADTPVTTADGEKPISAIQVGDQVLGYTAPPA